MCSKSTGLTCPGLPGPRSRAGPGARLRLLPQGPRTEGSSWGPHPGELGRSCPRGQPRSQKGPHVGVKSAARDSQQGHLRAPGSPAGVTDTASSEASRKVSGLTTKCDVGRRHATRVTWLSHGPYATLKAAGGWCGAPARHGHSVRAALRWPLSTARPASPPPRRSGLPSRGPDPERRAASPSLQDEAERTPRASDPIQPWHSHGSQRRTVLTSSVWEKNE